MEFSVGDCVVHPHHGPGRIASIERRELLDRAKRYYAIEIPDQGLTVLIPVGKADEVGVRPALLQSRFSQVLLKLGSTPRRLPDDYKERQEQIDAQLKTGLVMQLARVIRDLSWHKERAHLTKKDADCLKQGRGLLAAEMALVSGDKVSDARDLIEATMAAAMVSA